MRACATRTCEIYDVSQWQYHGKLQAGKGWHICRGERSVQVPNICVPFYEVPGSENNLARIPDYEGLPFG